MNAKEISNMPAGRIMDGLIAEKIFKFGDIQEFDSELSGRTFSGWIDDKNKSIIRPEFWQPSESIESAWEVLQEFGKLGYLWQLQNQENGRANGYQFALFIGEVVHRGYAETAPLAICRAALLAVVPAQQGGV